MNPIERIKESVELQIPRLPVCRSPLEKQRGCREDYEGRG